MFLKKGEKYLLTYNVGNYTEIGTYTGIIHWNDDGIEHRFKVGERSVLVLEEEIKEIKQDLMNELKEGIDALKERRNAEREGLDERLGKRDRVDQEETFAPHMEEKQYVNMHDLVKDYARLIDGQREEIKTLRQVISDIAANLGNGSTVSTEASIEFIKELPEEVKLVCNGLRKEISILENYEYSNDTRKD
jgi:hypothetical protein